MSASELNEILQVAESEWCAASGLQDRGMPVNATQCGACDVLSACDLPGKAQRASA